MNVKAMRGCGAMLLAALLAPAAAVAQSEGANGYVARLLDGQDAIGEKFALVPRPGGGDWLGFTYLPDQGELYAGNCSTHCAPRVKLTSGDDRGRYVSAAARPALLGAPAFVAFYNATAGNLEAIDCSDGSCNFGALRVLASAGDVGAGTATAVDLATGRPYVAYYDVDDSALRLYRCADAACTSGDSVLVDASGDRGRDPVMTIVNGAMTIVYEDTGTSEVRLAIGYAPYANFGTRPVASGRDPVLVPDAAGLVDILYTGGGGNVERRRCAAVDCLVLQTPGAISTAADSGHDPSATRLPDGNLFVTHRDAAGGALLGARCNDAD